MERATPAVLNPSQLPPGTEVGPWRVVSRADHGVYGTVYRAVPVDKEHAAPVALKLARLPQDPRFAREAELLQRLRHSSIPRLWDSGEWSHPGGTRHPYLVMDWIEGAPLYIWAQQHPPSSEQVLRWLSQLARALQAVHSQGAVHRDVKGSNIFVRRSDGCAVLIDFGSGTLPGAATLTPPGLCLGTPAYRSPEGGLFELRSVRDPSAQHVARPAEDLYALGVTACRLVTGEYPAFGEPSQDERGTWHLESVIPPASLQQVEPPLRELILRMLSPRPEHRGTAAELAEEMEKAELNLKVPPAESPRLVALPEAQKSLPTKPTPAQVSPAPLHSRADSTPWRALFAIAAMGLVLVTGALWSLSKPWGHARSLASDEAAGSPDAGTAGLGEATASLISDDSLPPSSREVLAEETPPEPIEGQVRPDAKGHCPHKRQVALNGGCWVVMGREREECEAANLHLYKGACYVPVMLHGRPPTSAPAHP